MAFELKFNGYDTGNKQKNYIFYKKMKFWDTKGNDIYKNLSLSYTPLEGNKQKTSFCFYEKVMVIDK